VYHVDTHDTEILNSRISGKKKVYVSCSHSYRCNCRTVTSGSGKNKTTSTVCDTCYEHSNDWDWDVYTGIGNTITINRVDRRGSNEPPRWTNVKINEPASVTHGYKNYIKASPGSLFRRTGQIDDEKQVFPVYPGDIFDYYRLNRLVLVDGAKVSDPYYWNADISELNAKIGAKKQANVIVVLTQNQTPDYFYKLEQHWIGGKKNDVILVANLGSDRKPTWVNVMTWENNEIFKIKVRDELLEKSSFERWDVIDVLERNIIKYHDRKPMASFEYLMATITPSTTEWIVSILIGVFISVGMSIFFHKNETFPSYRHRRRAMGHVW